MLADAGGVFEKLSEFVHIPDGATPSSRCRDGEDFLSHELKGIAVSPRDDLEVIGAYTTAELFLDAVPTLFEVR